MASNTIRAKVDSELLKRVGRWFTVREIQDRLRINPATLKPLIMKYARENVLKRRHVKGTARSVEFTPAAPSTVAFQTLLMSVMPYRSRVARMAAVKKMTKVTTPTKTTTKTPTKTAKKAAPKKSTKKTTKPKRK